MNGHNLLEDAWREILARELSSGEMRSLQAALERCRESPFQFQPDSGRFELSDEWMMRSMGAADERAGGEPGLPEAPDDPEGLDVLLRACDVLNDHIDELRARGAIGARPAEGGEFSVSYEFISTHAGPGIDDFAVAERLARLLRQYREFRVIDEDLGGVRRIAVRFRYRSDSEYGAMKSRLDWLVELARRLKENRPYRGGRL